MARWTAPTRLISSGGWIQIVMSQPGRSAQDVTFFRGVPTQVNSFSNADPFGDSTAVITFPQFTAFEDPQASDLINWFGIFANVDIWWVPEATAGPGSLPNWIDPLTNTVRDIAPANNNRIKLWEGFVSSIDYSASDTGHTVQMQCQGALFQLDRYLQKPYYPPRPVPLEKLIAATFDPKQKPHLRTKPLKTVFPSWWKKKVPTRNSADTGALATYVLDAKPGDNWTGYASRQTGSWERCLTGFIQDQLTLMVVQPSSGTTTFGDQWTVIQELQTATTPGRTPVLQIRTSARTPDFSLWVGTPGVTMTFSRDGTQMANVVYGDGTSVDGTSWNGAVISNDGTRTDYQPLAWESNIYPYTSNKLFSTQPFAAEAYLKFGAGFEQAQAQESAATQLSRDLDPGYSGNITMKIDPTQNLSKWQIRAGMTVKVLGVAGTGTGGLNMHISAVEASPEDNSVALTVDSRFRDLLTVQEALARTRDPLTPTRMLQVNRTSVMVEDIIAPWNYKAGSGFIPTASTTWWDKKPTTTLFPYVAQFKKYPPRKYSHWYVGPVKANAVVGKSYKTLSQARTARWFRVPILTAEKCTIRRIEVICLDANGNILKIPFHFSLWYVKATPQAMPRDKDGPSPYINNAFTEVDPATGNPWPPGNFLAPEPQFIMGWGSKINGQFNRAGFYPGSEISGSPASGILVDSPNLQIDNTQQTNQNWNPNATVGKQTKSAYTIYGMFYAEYKAPVYFLGRMWRQEPGST